MLANATTSGLSRKQIGSILKYHFPPKKKIVTKDILWEPDEINKLLTAYREIVFHMSFKKCNEDIL